MSRTAQDARPGTCIAGEHDRALRLVNICVQTSPTLRGEAEPHIFFIGGCRKIVASILEHWVDHPHRYYKVRSEDGRRFLLRYDAARQSWELAGVYAATVRTPKPAVQPRRWWSALLRAS